MGPIDEISFDFQVLHPDSIGTATTITAGPADGCYVHGLFIEGASWNSNANNLLDMASYGGENGTGAIVESAPKQLFSTMPVIWFWPRPISEIPVPVGRPGGTAQVYTCPVYKTSERKGTLSTTGHSTNFVIDISLPIGTNSTHMHWIKRGVAMLTTAD